ncbi:hypothetical protein Pla110_09880 [Polystyrenella longa]|uniref:Uncharacterized protein n=1 Tax=Polystyrenella longa TaxID=2528007 RepID=A0A518CJ78_9PLAN|nr:hypothetical protein [Polystyrenella longa]QDU79282.1 hypothetical protein Pla110_09880 [Polystyrenella longa]
MTEPSIETFSAHHLHLEDEDGLAQLVFAADDFDPEDYLLLQRTFSSEEEDENIAEEENINEEAEPTPEADVTEEGDTEDDGDGFYLELHSQMQSITSGVLSFSLTRTTLKVKLNPVASEVLGTSEIHVKYSHAKVNNTVMRELLAKIAGDIPIV